MRVLKHVGSLGRPAVCGRPAIEAKPPTTASHATCATLVGLSNGFRRRLQSLDLGHLGEGMVAV